MPAKTKKELLAEASEAGVEVPDGATNAQIQELLDKHEPAETPESEEVAAAKPDGDANDQGDPTDRRDPPANDHDVGGAHEGEPQVDEASGAIITGEDEQGRPLTTDDVAAGAEPAAPGHSKDAKDESVTTTETTFDGTRSIDTVDGVTQDPRPATFDEHVKQHAPEILSTVVKNTPWAGHGDINVDGSTLTITLYAN